MAKLLAESEALDMYIFCILYKPQGNNKIFGLQTDATLSHSHHDKHRLNNLFVSQAYSTSPQNSRPRHQKSLGLELRSVRQQQ